MECSSDVLVFVFETPNLQFFLLLVIFVFVQTCLILLSKTTKNKNVTKNHDDFITFTNTHYLCYFIKKPNIVFPGLAVVVVVRFTCFILRPPAVEPPCSFSSCSSKRRFST